MDALLSMAMNKPGAPRKAGSGITVKLPYREDARTQAFHVSKTVWADKNTTLIKIRGLDVDGQPLSAAAGRQELVIALDDLPLVLAGIRRALAGPLEQLLMDAEAHYRSVNGGGENG